jgi:hypothetical protein
MALGDDFIVLAGLARFDFPDAIVRLCDGAAVKWGSDLFAPTHATYGALASADGVEDVAGDLTPGGDLELAIPGDVPMADVYSDELLDRRVRLWLAEVNRATGLVTGTPVPMVDALVDQLRWRPATRTLGMTLASRAERFFQRNRGNVAGSAHHKSIWPDERGFDNCTDVAVPVPWGTGAAPRGVTSGGVTSGGVGGGGPGFRLQQVNPL